MGTEYTKEIVLKALRSDLLINHLKVEDNTITAYFVDNTCCILDLQESFQILNIDDDTIQNYLGMLDYYAAHSRVDFVNDVQKMSESRPGVYFMFIILMRMKELKIITSEILHFLFDGIIENEDAFNQVFSLLFGVEQK